MLSAGLYGQQLGNMAAVFGAGIPISLTGCSGAPGHFKRSLEFVQIGMLILKVSDVDFDFLFC